MKNRVRDHFPISGEKFKSWLFVDKASSGVGKLISTCPEEQYILIWNFSRTSWQFFIHLCRKVLCRVCRTAFYVSKATFGGFLFFKEIYFSLMLEVEQSFKMFGVSSQQYSQIWILNFQKLSLPPKIYLKRKQLLLIIFGQWAKTFLPIGEKKFAVIVKTAFYLTTVSFWGSFTLSNLYILEKFRLLKQKLHNFSTKNFRPNGRHNLLHALWKVLMKISLFTFSHYKRKFSEFLLETFPRGCQNCILQVHKYEKKLFDFFIGPPGNSFSTSVEKLFCKFGRTAFYMSRGAIWEKFFK